VGRGEPESFESGKQRAKKKFKLQNATKKSPREQKPGTG